jgi:hypothetical protein
MTGMRIQIGTQAIERAPSYIEIFGRTMQLNLSRSRWFDFPFTREEALQADKKLNLFSESLTSDANSVLIRPWNCLLPAYDSPVFRTLSLPPPLSSPVVSAIGKLSFI